MLYSLFNTTVSRSGLALNTIYTCIALVVFFAIFGVIYCIITGTFWYNPIHIVNGNGVLYFYTIFVFIPIAIGVGLNTLKVQNYKLIDYLKIYIKPKKILNQNGKPVKPDGYDINTFVERI